MISPSDMVLFAAVVRAGSFSQAARQLGITKQAASERIRRLEERLGVRLLERTTRQLRVTSAGAGYYDRCAAIAVQIEEANREVQQQDPEPVGLLRIASPALYARRYLSPVISRFLLQNPKASVELVFADRRPNLVEDGFDLAIHIGALDDSSLVTRRIGEAKTFVVASPKFIKQFGTPTARTLGTTRCIGLHPIEYWEVRGTKVRVEPVLTVADLELALEAALAGVGVARIPSILCDDLVRQRRLKLLFGPKPAALRPIQVLYPSRLHLPAKVRAFLDLLG